jgi:predicted dehydrogenase
MYLKKKMIRKILIVGYGSSGRRYYSIIKKIFPSIVLKIFSLSNLNKNQLFLKNFSDIKIFRPDLSIICNPSSTRVKIIKFLISLNSHLLIEKPLASNYKDVKKIIKIVKKKKLLVKVGYNLRFLNSLKVLKQIIKSNKIGKIYTVNIIAGQSLLKWRKNINYKHSVSAQKKLGGGVLLELSHEIDYGTWIFGSFNHLFSRNSKISDLRIDVEDNAQILFFSKNKHPVSINLDFFRKDKSRICHVVGKNGSLIWDGVKNKLIYFCSDKKKWINIKFEKNDIKSTYALMLKEMIKLCNSRNNVKSNLVDINHAGKVVRLIDFAIRSSKYLKVIKIK